MFDANQYQLVDFGEGRKLERFGAYLLDRPAAGTEVIERTAPATTWREAAKYVRSGGDRGVWKHPYPLPTTWEVHAERTVFQIKPTEFGHVGVFPEQADNWRWLTTQFAAQDTIDRPLKLLNLFAYTGGSTLVVANAGAEVVHVDAAANTVAWARQNAGLSGLAEAPIRWIVEDAEKFVRRELRRGNRYDGVILDPPTYGHGPKGEPWKIGDGLPNLLSMIAELTDGAPRLMLLTCHSPGFNEIAMRQLVAEAFDRDYARTVKTTTMGITAADGRQFTCGCALRGGIACSR